MSFGKKKSALPQRAKQQQTIRAKERIVNAPSRRTPVDDAEPDMDAMRTLTMAEVFSYAVSVCEARGYPEDSSLSFGMMAVWLAKRGMPSLSFMSKMIFENAKKDLRQQGPRQENGITHMPCPLVGTAFLKTGVDELVAAGVGKAMHTIVGGPTILMASRLSDHAERHNIALHMAITPLNGPHENPTVVTVHKDEISIQPGTGSLYHPSHVTLRFVPETHIPSVETFSSPPSHRKTLIVQAALLDLIEIARKSAGLPPTALRTPDSIQVVGAPALKDETKDFFRNMIQRDFDLQNKFAKLSKSDLSMLAASITNNAGQHDLEHGVFATTAGSANYDFYSYCTKLGWMMVYHDKTMNDYGMKTYQITKTGRMGMSVLMERLIMTKSA